MISFDSAQKETFINTVIDLAEDHSVSTDQKSYANWVKNFLFNNAVAAKTVDEEAKKLLHFVRYPLYSLTYTDILLKTIFEKSFSKYSKPIIHSMERVEGRFIYSACKKFIFIKIPAAVASVCGNKNLQFILDLYLFDIVFNFLIKYYFELKIICKNIISIPLLNTAATLYLTLLLQNLPTAILMIWVIKELILYLPNIPYLTHIANSLTFWNLISLIIDIIDAPFYIACLIAIEAQSLTDFLLLMLENSFAFWSFQNKTYYQKQDENRAFCLWKKLIIEKVKASHPELIHQ